MVTRIEFASYEPEAGKNVTMAGGRPVVVVVLVEVVVVVRIVEVVPVVVVVEVVDAVELVVG